MGLSSSLWSSVSGLLTHGEKMNVIGNNIANVNTIGFKSQRMDFHDFIYQSTYSASGPAQVGRGVGVNAILGDFSQGSFETTNDPMDLAIGGNGFFQVKDPYSDQVWYTRAGNFRFDKEGYLTNPQGLILQGWKIDNRDGPTLGTGASPTVTTKSSIQGSGVPMDIVLDSWTVPPKQTTKIEMRLNLTADSGYDKTTNVDNPFFALSQRWNGTQPPTPAGSPPLSTDAYAYQSSIKVYDEGGTAHTITTYFDQIIPTEIDPITHAMNIDNLPTGYKMYEYIVTMPPSEDMRTWDGAYDPVTGVLTGATSFQDGPMAGVLMIGTITFNASGQIVNQTAYTYMGNEENPYSPPVNGIITTSAPYGLGPDDPTTWQPTAVSNSGYVTVVPNFTGQPMANSVRQVCALDKPQGSDYLIEIDLGFKCVGNTSAPWVTGALQTPVALNDGTNMTTAMTGTAPQDYAELCTLKEGKKAESSTQSLSGSSVTRYNYQNGYTSGDLNNTYTDQNGVLYGIYSNGVTMGLYQVTLYDFVDPQGLRREGGNLFSATLESGNPKIGPANQNGMGSVNSYSIEQSNVDMAREFVQMITTQRGFQANSKGVTTVDTMLETVINMKR